MRRVWTVLLALPLAVPSFVGGFVMVSALGPGGMLQDLLEPLGVEQLPSIYGFWGAWLTLTLFSLPVRLPADARRAASRSDPALEESARSLGKTARQTFFRVNLPLLRPAIAAGAILVALYSVSEFGAVSMLRYDTLTPLVYIHYTTSFDRSAAAVLGLPLLAAGRPDRPARAADAGPRPLPRHRAGAARRATCRSGAGGGRRRSSARSSRWLGIGDPARGDLLLAGRGLERGRVDAAALRRPSATPCRRPSVAAIFTVARRAADRAAWPCATRGRRRRRSRSSPTSGSRCRGSRSRWRSCSSPRTT